MKRNKHPNDLVIPIVLPGFAYPVLKFWRVRLGHTAIAIISAHHDVCHLIEFGRYHPCVRGGSAVRSFLLPSPRFRGSKVDVDSLPEIFHTISGIQKHLGFMGNLIELPSGGALAAIKVAKAWAQEPKIYNPLVASCQTFTSTVLTSLGEIGPVGDPRIRERPPSDKYPRFVYDGRKGELRFLD